MKTVKTHEGREISIIGFQQSLKDWPMTYRAALDDDGKPYLTGNCVYANNKCGCEISGNGTLQFPMKIVFCEKHSK